jgi:hypothetical protein
MPWKEPAPLFGTAAQPDPKVPAAAFVPLPVPVPVPEPPVPAVELLELPQAARPRVAPRATAAIPERRSVVFMVDLFWLAVLVVVLVVVLEMVPVVFRWEWFGA